jgi:Tol biopolymer transport system component
MVAVRDEGSWTTFVLVRGLEPQVLDEPILQLSGWPAWSNDGTRIAWIRGAFRQDLALWVAAADGAAPRKLATLPVSDLGQLSAPAWLPDDSRIAVPNVPESRLSFLLVDPDGVAPAMSLDDQGGTVDWQTVAR